MESKKLLVAAALSGLLLGGQASGSGNTNTEAKEGKGKCHGVNKCKGKGECAGKNNSCGGHNKCKGKGWTEMTEKECKTKKGKFEEKK